MQPQKRPNRDRSVESLEARLRALPPPPIPADLEERLLATIPAAMPIRPRRLVIRLGAAGVLAAACLLAVLVWHVLYGEKPEAGPAKNVAVQLVQPNPKESVAEGGAWRKARHELNVEETPAFAWPLLESTPLRESRSIPTGLLD